MWSFEYLSICLLLLVRLNNAILVDELLQVPSIPDDHLLCWIRALPTVEIQIYRKSCREASYDFLDINDWNAPSE